MLAWKPKSEDPTVASVRYRCLLPLRVLRARGFPVELYSPNREEDYTGIIFSKLYDTASQELARRLKQKGSTIVLDVCDNHFYNPYALSEYKRAAEDLRRMIALVDLIVCSTETLAEECRSETGSTKRIIVIGDPVETLPEAACEESKGKVRFGHILRGRPADRQLPILLWFGSHGSPNAPSGMLDILNIADLLERVNRSQPFELLVVSNNREKYEMHIAPLSFRTQYADWDRNDFAQVLRRSAGVLIPVNLNPFTLCKTNNRLAMALYYGVPVVADSIPSYEEFRPFVFLDQWQEGLEAIVGNPKMAKEMAGLGHRYVMEHWMHDRIVARWEQVLVECVPFVRSLKAGT